MLGAAGLTTREEIKEEKVMTIYRTRSSHVFCVAAACFLGAVAFAQDDPYAEPEEPGLPPSNMELDLSRTAIVITDPQIDFLSLDGVT